MTLIAIACKGNSAEILTDTSLYSRHIQTLGRSSKQIPIATLGAAVLTQGDVAFGATAKVIALELAANIGTFDGLAEHFAESLLAQADDMRGRGELADDATLTAFLVGPSEGHGCYVAYAYPGENDFQQVRLDDVFAIPTPFDSQPHDFEAARVESEEAEQDARDAANGHPNKYAASVLVDNWRKKPALSMPRGRTEWVALAKRVRDQRSMSPGFARVVVCGDLHLTRLGRKKVESSVVHSFNDTGSELMELVAWSWHPLSQARECHCGSGQRYIDCHLVPFLDEDCCNGKPLRDCCAITTVEHTFNSPAVGIGESVGAG